MRVKSHWCARLTQAESNGRPVFPSRALRACARRTSDVSCPGGAIVNPRSRATRPPAQGCGTQSVPRQGHNTPLPLERSPPASFKRLLGSAPSGLLELVNKKYPVWPLGSSGTSRPHDEKPNTITWCHLICEVRQDLRLYW